MSAAPTQRIRGSSSVVPQAHERPPAPVVWRDLDSPTLVSQTSALRGPESWREGILAVPVSSSTRPVDYRPEEYPVSVPRQSSGQPMILVPMQPMVPRWVLILSCSLLVCIICLLGVICMLLGRTCP